MWPTNVGCGVGFWVREMKNRGFDTKKGNHIGKGNFS